MTSPYISICLLFATLAGCSSQHNHEAPSTSKGVLIEQDDTVAGNVVWKKAPNGLAIGISHAGALMLYVHFQNQGTNDITGLIQSPTRFILELNGKYYATADHGGKTSFMPPGRTYGPLKIDLTKFWEIPKLIQHYIVEPNDLHPVFKKGNNTLRLHYKIENELIPTGVLTIEE